MILRFFSELSSNGCRPPVTAGDQRTFMKTSEITPCVSKKPDHYDQYDITSPIHKIY